MYEWGEKLKKRRAQQIRSMKPHFPREWEPNEERALWRQRKPTAIPKWKRKLMIQTMISLLLLGVTYLSFQTESPPSKQMQVFLTEAVNRSFNFQGMTAWYQEYMGSNPTILPAFKLEDKADSIWYSPVSGNIVLPFNQKRNGVVVRTDKNAPVVAPADAWVQFAGEKEGIGKTVILKHTNGKETWFSLLGSYEVKQRQWVKKGERIGMAGEKSGQSLVYVAVKQGEKFINPVDVIPFD